MYTNQKWDINSANKQEVNSFNGVNIADCSKSIMISNEEKEANAKLISAAPELLEACKISLECAKQFSAMTSGAKKDAWDFQINKLAKAIAKAEGVLQHSI